MNKNEFATAFATLAGTPGPFPWQWELYKRFIVGDIPASCNLPTGLGKTSVIHVWLLALSVNNKLPRRLVYVVNRRTVVDQTTNEVENLRERLPDVPEVEAALWALCSTRPEKPDPKKDRPLAISTLRGQFADNREWSADPSRPAVICGTVDMIGSRLLFSGYGCGFKTRPLHAGFLGQDALIVHDEAHLEPAFQELLVEIEKEQQRCKDFRPLRVVELTATSRADGPPPFTLSDEDYKDETVQRRVGAKKALHLQPNKDEKKLADEIADLALKHKESGSAILVFVRKVDDVDKVTKKLPKGSFEQLTGTLRGLERDDLVKKPIFQRFLPPSNRNTTAAPQPGTVYLVCTSAGEVGVNISADHLVCDLSTFESMAQRFGRVNRFGERTDTEIHVVHPREADFDGENTIDVRRMRTLTLLLQLNGQGSPAALGMLDPKARQEAFAPTPTILPVSDILFDAWALTTIRAKLPGRPLVEAYLHGISDDQPQTTIAWREEVDVLTEDILQLNKLDPETVLELFPLKPHEELSGPTHGRSKVFEQLEEIAARDAKQEPDKRLSAWVIDTDGTVTVHTLSKLVEKDRQNKPVVGLGGRTVLLPPRAGGFSGGLLKGDEPYTKDITYDVSDELFLDTEKKERRRIRLWENDTALSEVRKVMRLVRVINIPVGGADEDAEGRSWYWFERPRGGDDEGSKSAATKDPIALDHHTKDVTDSTRRIVSALGLPGELHKLLVIAAQFHDLGKQREVWQRSIGNPKPKGPPWFAKSGRDWTPREITDYRHEFGSLIDVTFEKEFTDLVNDDLRAFVLHVIATHHGRGRPHFPEAESFDPERSDNSARTVAREVPQRFARLQRQYGRWGLAYLESLLRAADYAASAKPSAFVTEGVK
ncbi:type I-U CRISPR-associated helicase/endonuclease Cas3 [Gemmata sp. JC673]|uniref:Type I-U CRISPR-associated helicase/endonuclease Cas3 n=1 Tax=Gemmata algarum TaxID=2975278 RepID=A0ABU5EU01_9BACT|nr:type I-U CRISPR-associated helicase/endonuclease Cas3 [Gemmata algarum]MDY3558635.1 type I-U CRISPR-associated helicase/endonuclease Cas3 [Gemmata algarum]